MGGQISTDLWFGGKSNQDTFPACFERQWLFADRKIGSKCEKLHSIYSNCLDFPTSAFLINRSFSVRHGARRLQGHANSHVFLFSLNFTSGAR